MCAALGKDLVLDSDDGGSDTEEQSQGDHAGCLGGHDDGRRRVVLARGNASTGRRTRHIVMIHKVEALYPLVMGKVGETNGVGVGHVAQGGVVYGHPGEVAAR